MFNKLKIHFVEKKKKCYLKFIFLQNLKMWTVLNHNTMWVHLKLKKLSKIFRSLTLWPAKPLFHLINQLNSSAPLPFVFCFCDFPKLHYLQIDYVKRLANTHLLSFGYDQ